MGFSFAVSTYHKKKLTVLFVLRIDKSADFIHQIQIFWDQTMDGNQLFY